jgi:hypothetical protein
VGYEKTREGYYYWASLGYSSLVNLTEWNLPTQEQGRKQMEGLGASFLAMETIIHSGETGEDTWTRLSHQRAADTRRRIKLRKTGGRCYNRVGGEVS